MFEIDLSERTRTTSVSCVSSDSMPWIQDSSSGGYFKLLQVDRLSGLWVVRSKFGPGTSIQLHLHSGPVSAFTLSGHWGYPELGVTCHAGDYLVEEAGTVHSLSVIGGETTDIVFSILGAIIYFNGDQTVDRIEDWRSVLAGYVAGCDALEKRVRVIGSHSANAMTD